MRKPVFYAGRTEISVIKFDDIQVRIVSINGERGLLALMCVLRWKSAMLLMLFQFWITTR